MSKPDILTLLRTGHFHFALTLFCTFVDIYMGRDYNKIY